MPCGKVCCLWLQLSDEDRERVDYYLDQYPGQVQKILKVHVNVDDDDEDCEGEDCSTPDESCDCDDDDCDCEEVGPQNWLCAFVKLLSEVLAACL